MKILSSCVLITALLLPGLASADDASGNRVAAYIKENLIWQTWKYYDGDSGFCDLMIKMNHKNGYAIIQRVSTTGDSKLCRFLKSKLRKGSKYRYDHPEKLIQIQIVH